MSNNASASMEKYPSMQNRSDNDIAKIQQSPLICFYSCDNKQAHVRTTHQSGKGSIGCDMRNGTTGRGLTCEQFNKSRRLMQIVLTFANNFRVE